MTRQKQYRDEDILAAFGKKVRAIRMASGLSQQQLAHNCGIELSQINRIELGKINTSISHLFLIASQLGVSAQELVNLEAS